MPDKKTNLNGSLTDPVQAVIEWAEKATGISLSCLNVPMKASLPEEKK